MIIGFAGAGNMARAMARGWAEGDDGPEQMLFCDSGSGRAAALAEEVGGEAVPALADLGLRSDAVVLAVKPAALEVAAEQLGGAADAVLSVLGATPVSRLREVFGGEIPIVRVMPTVAAEIGEGVICHAPITPADGAVGAELLDLVSVLGHLVEVEDELMDPATAVMGCTPAYLAVFVQALAEEGTAQGLDPELAYDLVVDAFTGTLEVLRRYDPIEVRRAVASPGGSTEAGLESLADHGVADALKDAVRASLRRMRG
jgi:pyrroline-5-carboxylate reductase